MGKREYPEWINEVAEIIGLSRHRRNKTIRKKHPRYSRFNADQEKIIDIIGAKAELYAALHLFQDKRKFSLAPLLAKRSDQKVDIILLDRLNYPKVDVKALINLTMRVNEEQHKKKEIDFYWFIRFAGKTTAHSYLVPHQEVNEWRLEQGQYGSAYFEKSLAAVDETEAEGELFPQ